MVFTVLRRIRLPLPAGGRFAPLQVNDPFRAFPFMRGRNERAVFPIFGQKPGFGPSPRGEGGRGP